ncbi:MAG: manganese-binding transcriptional regulator MntR [Bdellovibrionaceae bacterium]|nr:manganese-binding transcriptional regulator MntR [Pseudobdellovibrionaceae bacterium]
MAEDMARAHRLTRRQHATETSEDYVEAIAVIQEETGTARVTDLAQRLGVAHPTVIQKVKRLVREGLVATAPYRALELTKSGAALARASRRRHALVKDFLLALGVPSVAAEVDAEGIEHHAGPETLAAMERYLRTRTATAQPATARRRRDTGG